MINVVSAWRYLRGAEGFNRDLDIICRLPDAASIRTAEVHAIDLGDNTTMTSRREGDTLHIPLSRHGKATVILLR